MLRTRLFEDLLATFENLKRRQRTLLVAIDGRGGSGKTLFAASLADFSSEISVVQMDDFYKPSLLRERSRSEIGAAFDWRRLEDQVLRPLGKDSPAHYQRYDWDEDELAGWNDVPFGETVFVEGNYASRSELRPYYDYVIWVEAPHDVRLKRGIERDGESARERWLAEWMPEEDRYVREENPRAKADLIVDGAPTSEIEPRLEFVEIGKG